jgi:hypothetical protein
MDDEEHSISWKSSHAWNKYNPAWLLEKVDSELQNAPDDPSASKIFDVSDMRQAFRDGFESGAAYFITKEIPWEGEP